MLNGIKSYISTKIRFKKGKILACNLFSWIILLDRLDQWYLYDVFSGLIAHIWIYVCWIPFLNVFLDENKDEDCHLKRRERLIELKRHEDDPDYTPDGENENYQVFNNSNGR